MNYDFDNFKKRYGLEDDVTSSFDELENVENDDSLYNELIPSSTYNLEDTIRLEKNAFEQINPITISDSDEKDEVSDFFEDELEKTLEIDTFKLDYELEELLEPVKKEKKKWWHLPISTANDHHLEHAFVNCAVLGFITAAMGSGMLLYIINHINPL